MEDIYDLINSQDIQNTHKTQYQKQKDKIE